MRHLPVEDREDLAFGRHQEVAGAVVGVHDGELRRRARRVAAQPADRRAHDRLGLELVLVDHALPVVELVAPARVEGPLLQHLGQAEGLGVGAVDLAEDRPLALADPLEVRGVGRREERLGARLAAAHLLHHEEGTLEPARVLLEPERGGHGHRSAVEGGIGRELDGALGLDQAARRIAAQDQPVLLFARAAPAAQHQPIGLPRGAAVDAHEPFDAHVAGLGPAVGGVGGEACGEIRHGCGFWQIRGRWVASHRLGQEVRR